MGHLPPAGVVEAAGAEEATQQHDGGREIHMPLWGGQPGIQAVDVVGAMQAGIVRGEAACTRQSGDCMVEPTHEETLTAGAEGVILRKAACLVRRVVFATLLGREGRPSARTAGGQVRRVSTCQVDRTREGAWYLIALDRCQTWFSPDAPALAARNPDHEAVPVLACLAHGLVPGPSPASLSRIFPFRSGTSAPHT